MEIAILYNFYLSFEITVSRNIAVKKPSLDVNNLLIKNKKNTC
jgi:hypothetical protein